MKREELQELGLSEGEAEIYLALLTANSANVMQLSKMTGRHRTHIYDTLEKLKEKGLVSESFVDNKKTFNASDPQNLLDLLKEKEEKTRKVVAELSALRELSQKEIVVETFKGKSGLKSTLRDILREKKEYVGYGEGLRFGKILPTFYEQFRRESLKLGIGLRLIVKKGVVMSQRKGLQVKHLDYITPSTIFVYGDKVLTIIWEPFPTAIRMTDKQLAKSYKSYFEILWKNASS